MTPLGAGTAAPPGNCLCCSRCIIKHGGHRIGAAVVTSAMPRVKIISAARAFVVQLAVNDFLIRGFLPLLEPFGCCIIINRNERQAT